MSLDLALVRERAAHPEYLAASVFAALVGKDRVNARFAVCRSRADDLRRAFAAAYLINAAVRYKRVVHKSFRTLADLGGIERK